MKTSIKNGDNMQLHKKIFVLRVKKNISLTIIASIF